MQRILNVSVLGGGSFGTALATVAARCGHNVKILSKTEQTINEINKEHRNRRFFPDDIVIPDNVVASNNIEEVLGKTDMIIHAIPVQASYQFIKENQAYIPENIPYLIASKGILLKQKQFFSQAWPDLFPNKKVHHCVISGPSFAIELMKGYPTVVSLGCKDDTIAKFVQQNLIYDAFRTYTTRDVIGVEIGGALKNPLAIGAGIVEGLGYAFNTNSALITRGIFEIALFSEKYGGNLNTLYGLSGVGDVMLSCLGSLSRNKAVGIKLGKGQKLDDIIKNSKEVAEGVPTLLTLGDIMEEQNLNMPIMKNLNKLVKGEASIKEVQNALMLRRLEKEHELQI